MEKKQFPGETFPVFAGIDLTYFIGYLQAQSIGVQWWISWPSALILDLAQANWPHGSSDYAMTAHPESPIKHSNMSMHIHRCGE